MKEEHNDLNDEQIEDMLKEKWSELDEDQQSRFIPMGIDLKHLISDSLPEGVKRSMRANKTTPRKLNLEQLYSPKKRLLVSTYCMRFYVI